MKRHVLWESDLLQVASHSAVTPRKVGPQPQRVEGRL